MVLQLINAEKRKNDSLIFPAFNLAVRPGKVTALHSNVNVREELLAILLRKSRLSHGEIVFDQSLLESPDKVGFLFLKPRLYERLSIEEMLTFIKRLYVSEETIANALMAVRLEEKKNVKISKLTYSELKRTQLAALLLQKPDLYIFEEPDQNIDVESKRIFLSVLEQLRQEQKGVLILTGNMENAIIAADEVYRLDDDGISAVDMNPEEEQPISAMNSEQAELYSVRFEKIPTKVNEKIVLFDPPEIDYIESNDGQSHIYIKNESFPCSFTLQELEERLLPFGFFRCHRSYIVNLQKVREVIPWTRNSFSLVLAGSDSTNIPLSKSKMNELKAMLGL